MAMGRSWALLVVLLCTLQLQPTLQQCNTSDVRSKGARGDGGTDDANAFQAVDQDGNAGVIFMGDGTYRIGRTMTLTKSIIATAGAKFQVRTCDVCLQPGGGSHDRSAPLGNRGFCFQRFTPVKRSRKWVWHHAGG